MDLGKTYDTIDQHMVYADAKSVWNWRKIVESSEKFYVDSRACVRV